MKCQEVSGGAADSRRGLGDGVPVYRGLIRGRFHCMQEESRLQRVYCRDPLRFVTAVYQIGSLRSPARPCQLHNSLREERLHRIVDGGLGEGVFYAPADYTGFAKRFFILVIDLGVLASVTRTVLSA